MSQVPNLFNPVEWIRICSKLYRRVRERWGAWAANTLAALLFIVALTGLAWWNWDKIKTLPFVEPMCEWVNRKPLIKAVPGTFTVLVADLDNDPAGERKKNIITALGKIEGIAVEPLARCPGGTGAGTQAFEKSREEVREYLRETGAQIVLWGSYLEGTKKGVSLRMEVSREDGEGRTGDYLLGDLFLENRFSDELLDVLTKTVTARQTAFNKKDGHFVAELRPHTDKARKLLEAKQLSPDNKAAVRENLASALLTLGEQSGDSNALREAIRHFKLLLQGMPLTEDAQHRAGIQNNLGNALLSLGEIESGTERLDEAVQAYRAALTEYTQPPPIQWASTQNNLGNALFRLGEREVGTERLAEAVLAYRAALTEYIKEKPPLKWAATQNNLGNTLQILGERESGTERLEEAVQAYRAALTEYTQEKVPLDWAMTQNNLGNALQTLGERESGTERLEEAVRAYQAALTERTREKVPLNWAATQNNLGNALQTLGRSESDTKSLEEAVWAYRAALTVYTQETVPFQWAITQNNLGNALSRLGERESGTQRLEEAVHAYRAALAEYTQETVPLDWAMTQNNLGNAFGNLGQRTESANNILQALNGHLNAWTVFSGAKHYYAKATFFSIRKDLHVLAALSLPPPAIPQEYREKLTDVHAWAKANNLEFPEYEP